MNFRSPEIHTIWLETNIRQTEFLLSAKRDSKFEAFTPSLVTCGDKQVTCVDGEMHAEVALVCKSFATNGALVRPDAGVTLHVRVQLACRGKRLRAQVTSEPGEIVWISSSSIQKFLFGLRAHQSLFRYEPIWTFSYFRVVMSGCLNRTCCFKDFSSVNCF